MYDKWIPTILCKSDKNVNGIALDNNGIVYFTSGDTLYKIHNDNKPQTLICKEGSLYRGLVWNGHNNLYICDYNKDRILSYSTDSGILSTVAGNGKAGSTDGNIKNAEFHSPKGIAVDRNGDLYITQLRCVRKINLSEGTVITIAGSNVKGHKDGDAKQALLNFPKGIAVSDDDTIYIADEYNHCLRKIKDGIVSTISCACKYQPEFLWPKGIILDADGNLLVSDNRGLQKVDMKQLTVSPVDAVQGTEKMDIYCICYVNRFEFVVGTRWHVIRVEHIWKWKRFLWIGHLKENPNDCLLATVPSDIIKEISQFI